MFFHRIKASGVLSFGHRGIDFPMRKLNVLIGPNGSGKTNFLELIQLFRDAPSPSQSIAGTMARSGGVSEWLWKGDWELDNAPQLALLECEASGKKERIRHRLEFFDVNSSFRLHIADERIDLLGEEGDDSYPWWIYRYCSSGSLSHAQFHDHGPSEGDGPERIRRISHVELDPGASILSQVRDPGRYEIFKFLEESYSNLRLYRDWCFGPKAGIRKPNPSDGSTEALDPQGNNLALMVADMPIDVEGRVIHELKALYPEIVSVKAKPSGGGTLETYLIEEGDREIPASRLSDGTLRFLSLLIILLGDNPPPLIAIEEPELGLHPDVLPRLGKLLKEASERTQLVVTTHSQMLVDVLGDCPEDIVVCEKLEGETTMTRLDSNDLEEWLETYSLGDIWSKGEIGGNRW